MKIQIDIEKESKAVLNQVKNMIEDKLAEDYDQFKGVPPKLKIPVNILDNMEKNLAISLKDFEDALIKGGYDKGETQDIIQALKREGIVYEPSKGCIRLI